MRSPILFALLFVFAFPAVAQDEPVTLAEDVSASMQMVRERVVTLAGAVPEEKLSWRPAEGVRSISEVMAHVAAANYYFASLLGREIPEGVEPGSMEQSITESAEIIEAVNTSFDYFESILDGLTEEDLNASGRWFDGSERKAHFLLHFASTHAHEHLGQLIAYARMNDVVPPWSE